MGLKNIPMYLTPVSGKLKTTEANNEKTVKDLINLIRCTENLSFNINIETEK